MATPNSFEVATDPESARQTLDYYLISPAQPGGSPRPEPEVILVEEFVFGQDCTAERLDSAGWSHTATTWWSAHAFSRAIRADADLRCRVTAVSRHQAGDAYRLLGGGDLPAEAQLRTYFGQREPLPASAPLRLAASEPARGFHESRMYRILFANGPDQRGLANLRAAWVMTMVGDPDDPGARVIGTARRAIDGGLVTWELRRIGSGVAWGLDVTVHLAGSRIAIAPTLRDLMTTMRRQGLIPATVERFS